MGHAASGLDRLKRRASSSSRHDAAAGAAAGGAAAGGASSPVSSSPGAVIHAPAAPASRRPRSGVPFRGSRPSSRERLHRLCGVASLVRFAVVGRIVFCFFSCCFSFAHASLRFSSRRVRRIAIGTEKIAAQDHADEQQRDDLAGELAALGADVHGGVCRVGRHGDGAPRQDVERWAMPA